MTLRFRVVALLAVAAIAGSACSSGGSATATNNAGPSTKTVASVPADQLIKAGTLTVCSDTSYPPQEYLDANNKAIGSDIDLVNGIAARLGLQASVKSTVFDTIVPALTAGTCDISISAQFETADRLAQVDMVTYFAAAQSFVVLKGNPQGIKTFDDLCGKTVAAETGTVEADHIGGTGSGYDKTNGYSPMCTAKGKQPVTLKTYDKDTDALQAMQAGIVAAHFTDDPVAVYEVKNGNGAFEKVDAMTNDPIKEGICVTKNHTALRDAIRTALVAMINDGSYKATLDKWGVQAGAVSADDVNAAPKPS